VRRLTGVRAAAAILTLAALLAVLLVALATSAATGPGRARATARTAAADIATSPDRTAAADRTASADLTVQVLSSHPHDPLAYTQGLLLHEGWLYESTGSIGEGFSSLRRVDPRTGEVAQRFDLEPEYFGEGLTLVGEHLTQITWKNGLAFDYDLGSFERLGSREYSGEGWGICHDGERLVMTDGGSRLYFRDPESFEVIGSVTVTLDGAPLREINELECVGGSVYANVWTKAFIVRIDPTTGEVTERIDASALDDRFRELTGSASIYECLNGIAFDAADGAFYVTGKLWPEMYRVRFVPHDPSATPPPIPTPDLTPTAEPTATPKPPAPRIYAPYASAGQAAAPPTP